MLPVKIYNFTPLLKKAVTGERKRRGLPDIDIENFKYDLPQNRIAQYPLPERDKSKLLIYKNGFISETVFSDIDKEIPSGSVMIFNNSRVIKARLFFEKQTGSIIEIFCLEPVMPADFSAAMESKGETEWKCIIGNLKKWKQGKIKCQYKTAGDSYIVWAEKLYPGEDNTWIVRFTWDSGNFTFKEFIDSAGHVPLPPYIIRPDEPSDRKWYQTIYSSVDGSVAAPTAGLHFTDRVLEKLNSKGIRQLNVTLHVSAGTFRPVKSKSIQGHEMHSELFFVEKEIITHLLSNKGPIVSVGTTSLRVLESLYWAGIKLKMKPDTDPDSLYIDQWDPYLLKCKLKPEESLEVLLEWMEKNKTGRLSALTKLFIFPGYKFMFSDILLTNFHLPKSTLLMLVAAFTGSDWKKIYEYALGNNYRFLSYGDASLLFRKDVIF